MTREEFVRNRSWILRVIRSRCELTQTEEDYLNDLIEVLEQEPCEDAIGRAEAMTEIMMFAGNVKPDEENIYIKVSDAVQLLRELPPVTPKPKTGHWILQPSNKEQGERDFIWWKCSECGQVIYSETEQDRREYHAYCGRCGAKMLPTDSESGYDKE